MIKLIAVDMDATFLTNDMRYNKERFDKLFEEMQGQNIHFVVASGNQYYQLRSFFDKHKAMSFVSDNGANVICEDHDVAHAKMPWDIVHKVFDIIHEFDAVNILVCGKKSAYVPKTQPQSFYDFAIRYNHRMAWIDNLEDINDDILKFALVAKDEAIVEVLLERFHREVGDYIVPVASGHTSIDLIQPGVHKASGIQKLQDIWGIKDHEILAFGDNGNDIEMLKKAGIGVAVGNARDDVKAIADIVLEKTNNSEAILDFIEAMLRMQQ